MQFLHKRPFILAEVFIAIALLMLCAFPLISSSLASYYEQKKCLLELELERQAELAFYEVLKTELPEDYDAISKGWKAFHTLDRVSISLGVIQETYYPHYHLWYSKRSISPTHRKVHCDICFPKKSGGCKAQTQAEFPYRFNFLVKKVAEKPEDPHVEAKKEKSVEDEKPTQDIQASHRCE